MPQAAFPPLLPRGWASRPDTLEPDPARCHDSLRDLCSQVERRLNDWHQASESNDRARIANTFHEAANALRRCENALMLHYAEIKRARAYREAAERGYRRPGQVALLPTAAVVAGTVRGGAA